MDKMDFVNIRNIWEGDINVFYDFLRLQTTQKMIKDIETKINVHYNFYILLSDVKRWLLLSNIYCIQDREDGWYLIKPLAISFMAYVDITTELIINTIFIKERCN